jgi:hypothetical protein
MKFKKTLGKYMFGTDLSEYYDTQRMFYSEFITDPEDLEAKRERIDREERDIKILSVWIPNFSYVWGVAALVTGNPGFLMMNAGGESLRWIGRYFHRKNKESDELFRNDQVFIQEMKEGLPTLKGEGLDTRMLESGLNNLKQTLDSS